jgi:hypothetical protein
VIDVGLTASATIQSMRSGDFRILPLGEEGAHLVGGFGGWDTVDRPHELKLTEWNGVDPIMMDVHLMLDDFARDLSVQPEYEWVRDLARQHDGSKPPKFRVFGATVPFSGQFPWVMQDFEVGDFKRNVRGVLTRQELVLHCMQYVDPDTIKLNKRRGGGKHGKTRVYIVKKGEDLKDIAKKLFHNVGRWDDIAQLNHLRGWKSVKAGQKIKVPTD